MSDKMKTFRINFKNGRWQFDAALERAAWDEEIFNILVDKTVKGLDAAEKNEFWRQYNFWKWQTQQ